MSEPGAITPERTGDTLRVRFQLPRSAYLVVLFLALGVSVLLAQPWFAFLYLIPLAVGFFIARRGTDVDPSGLTVRALLKSETYPWAVVQGLSVSDKSRVYVVLGDGAGNAVAQVQLPCVGVSGLPVLAEASGGAVPELTPATIKAAPGRKRR